MHRICTRTRALANSIASSEMMEPHHRDMPKSKSAIGMREALYVMIGLTPSRYVAVGGRTKRRATLTARPNRLHACAKYWLGFEYSCTPISRQVRVVPTPRPTKCAMACLRRGLISVPVFPPKVPGKRPGHAARRNLTILS